MTELWIRCLILACRSAPDCGACDGPAWWQSAFDREDRQHPRDGHASIPHDSPYSAAAWRCDRICNTETQRQSCNKALWLNCPTLRTAPDCLKLWKEESTTTSETFQMYWQNLNPMMLVDMASKSPAIRANVTTIGTGMLNFLQVTCLYMLLHVLFCFTNMLTISASELASAHCHDLGIHKLQDSLVLYAS